MDSEESQRCQFLFSGGHRLPHQIASGFVHESDVDPLSLGHKHIDRVHKKNPSLCLDCKSRTFASTVTLRLRRLLFMVKNVIRPRFDGGNHVPSACSSWDHLAYFDRCVNK